MASSKSGRVQLIGAAVALVAVVVAVVFLARGFLAGGSGGGAQQAAQTAELTPGELESLVGRARQFLRQSQPAQAESVLRAALQRSPSSSECWALLAESLLVQNRPREAAEAFEQAVVNGGEDAELRFAAGSAASLAGQLDRAEEHYARAQQLAPSNPKHPLYLGQVRRKAGKTDQAKVDFLRAATLDPDLAIAWGSLAAISFEENNLSVATGYVKRARAAEPELATWRLLEAKILRRDGKPQESVRLLMAMDDQSRLADPTVLEELGLCFGLLQQPGEAAQLYAAAAERQPRNTELLHNAALWYERAGVLDAATVYATRAAELGHDPSRQLAVRLSEKQRTEAAATGTGKGEVEPNK